MLFPPCPVHFIIYPFILQSMSTIELLTRVLFYICHASYLAFMKCKCHLTDLIFSLLHLVLSYNCYLFMGRSVEFKVFCNLSYWAVRRMWNSFITESSGSLGGCFLVIIHSSLFHRRCGCSLSSTYMSCIPQSSRCHRALVFDSVERLPETFVPVSTRSLL